MGDFIKRAANIVGVTPTIFVARFRLRETIRYRFSQSKVRGGSYLRQPRPRPCRGIEQRLHDLRVGQDADGVESAVLVVHVRVKKRMGLQRLRRAPEEVQERVHRSTLVDPIHVVQVTIVGAKGENRHGVRRSELQRLVLLE